MSPQDFRDVVSLSFKFLEVDLKFSLLPQSIDFCTRFESAFAFIEVLYDYGRSYELGLRFGLIKSEELPFELREVQAWNHKESSAQASAIQVTGDNQLINAIHNFSKIVDQECRDLLRNPKAGFKDLGEWRRTQVHRYAEVNRLAFLRKELDEAWSKKDYSDVVKICFQIGSSKTAAEDLKLKYARKALKGEGPK